MKKMRYFAVTAVLLVACAMPSRAQKGNIGFIYPSGAQRGTTVEVTVGGQGISKANGVLISGDGGAALRSARVDETYVALLCP